MSTESIGTHRLPVKLIGPPSLATPSEQIAAICLAQNRSLPETLIESHQVPRAERCVAGGWEFKGAYVIAKIATVEAPDQGGGRQWGHGFRRDHD